MPPEKPLRRNGIPQEKRGYALVCLWARVRVRGERARERVRASLPPRCDSVRGSCSTVAPRVLQRSARGREAVREGPCGGGEEREREEGRRGELNRLPSFWRRAMGGGRGVWLNYYSFFFLFFLKEIRKLPFQ